jgi:hypothetical protein
MTSRPVIAFVAALAALLLATGFGIYQYLNNQDQSGQITQITRIVHSATCGGGHKKANLAACHRLCPNLERISNLRCGAVPTAEGVVGRNGNSPSSQRSPAPSTGGGVQGSGGGNGGSKPVSVTTPQLPVLGQPKVCTGLVGVNC